MMSKAVIVRCSMYTTIIGNEPSDFAIFSLAPIACKACCNDYVTL